MIYALTIAFCIETSCQSAMWEFESVNDTAAYLNARILVHPQAENELFEKHGRFRLKKVSLSRVDDKCPFFGLDGKATSIHGTGVACD